MLEAPTSDAPLHMVQLVLDGRDLERSAQRQRLPRDHEDTGYLLHGHLSALFGDLLPQPFHGHYLRRDVEVLGYCHSDRDTLWQRAQEFAEPMVLGSVQRLASKAMPTVWAPGRRLDFDVRVCPVVRLSSAVGGYHAGSEVDAFQAARMRGDQASSKAEVYRGWLDRRLDGAAQLLDFDIQRLRNTRLVRRNRHKEPDGRRKSPRLHKPDAWLRGTLEVADADAFGRLLARGIGRHRAFGFGMLRLRPSRTPQSC